jgi:hypothetical protein
MSDVCAPGPGTGHPGIRDVTTTGEGDLVEVTYAPAETSLAMLCQQVLDTVALPGVRSVLGRFASPQ